MIAMTIQLALAPAFVLVAIAHILALLMNRLARIVDRSRLLLDMHAATEGPRHDMVVKEIRDSDRRIHLIGVAIRLLVLASLAIGTSVAMLFLEEIAHLYLGSVAGGAFLLSMTLIMIALMFFLRETQIATANQRIPRAYLELEREL